MPKNKGKGGKNKKRGKNQAGAGGVLNDRRSGLVFKEDGQEYAQVLCMLGNCRLEAMCVDGIKRLCHIRGKLQNKFWIEAEDIILVGLRNYQDDKADVILKYQPDEARLLKEYGELPQSIRLGWGIPGLAWAFAGASCLDDEDDDKGRPGGEYFEFGAEDIDEI